jgi:hypothetical protein
MTYKEYYKKLLDAARNGEVQNGDFNTIWKEAQKHGFINDDGMWTFDANQEVRKPTFKDYYEQLSKGKDLATKAAIYADAIQRGYLNVNGWTKKGKSELDKSQVGTFGVSRGFDKVNPDDQNTFLSIGDPIVDALRPVVEESQVQNGNPFEFDGKQGKAPKDVILPQDYDEDDLKAIKLNFADKFGRMPTDEELNAAVKNGNLFFVVNNPRLKELAKKYQGDWSTEKTNTPDTSVLKNILTETLGREPTEQEMQSAIDEGGLKWNPAERQLYPPNPAPSASGNPLPPPDYRAINSTVPVIPDLLPAKQWLKKVIDANPSRKDRITSQLQNLGLIDSSGNFTNAANTPLRNLQELTKKSLVDAFGLKLGEAGRNGDYKVNTSDEVVEADATTNARQATTNKGITNPSDTQLSKIENATTHYDNAKSKEEAQKAIEEANKALNGEEGTGNTDTNSEPEIPIEEAPKEQPFSNKVLLADILLTGLRNAMHYRPGFRTAYGEDITGRDWGTSKSLVQQLAEENMKRDLARFNMKKDTKAQTEAQIDANKTAGFDEDNLNAQRNLYLPEASVTKSSNSSRSNPINSTNTSTSTTELIDIGSNMSRPKNPQYSR